MYGGGISRGDGWGAREHVEVRMPVIEIAAGTGPTLGGSNSYGGPVTLGGSSSTTGPISIGYVETLDLNLSKQAALAVANTLEKLLSAVDASTPCRCYETVVCPLCHDLNKARFDAQVALDLYRRHEQEKSMPPIGIGPTYTPTPLSVATDHIYLNEITSGGSGAQLTVTTCAQQTISR